MIKKIFLFTCIHDSHQPAVLLSVLAIIEAAKVLCTARQPPRVCQYLALLLIPFFFPRAKQPRTQQVVPYCFCNSVSRQRNKLTWTLHEEACCPFRFSLKSTIFAVKIKTSGMTKHKREFSFYLWNEEKSVCLSALPSLLNRSQDKWKMDHRHDRARKKKKKRRRHFSLISHRCASETTC